MDSFIEKLIKSTLGLMAILVFSLGAQATLPGMVIVDEENFWGQNGRFANPNSKAAYVVCDGYIASPQIPNTVSAVNSFINNCEITPPPSALPIIDTPENHSRHYQGYPAYEIKPPGADYVYFVCDGFLNSTSWCSYEAHRKATKLQRVAESRYWEAGENPLIINDRKVIRQQSSRYTEGNVTRYSTPGNTQNLDGSINRAYPSKLERIQAEPINKGSLPQGQKMKLQRVPLHQLSDEEIHNMDIPPNVKNLIKERRANNVQRNRNKLLNNSDAGVFDGTTQEETVIEETYYN